MEEIKRDTGRIRTAVSRTGINEIWVKNGCGKILKANIISSTERNIKRVREDILQWLPFQVLKEIKYGYGFRPGRN